MGGRATIDGNEAAAWVAYRASEVIAIYPITPATSMGELADAWSAQGIPNRWGVVPQVVEMQSEGGAAGAVHGALQTGALATTFTSSQGLLLMLPNMFKIAGELTPAVFHVAARTIATHALSIFGDHSDVMAARPTGFALLCSSSVQEAQDLALVAHAATMRARIPFLHFFDGFRTSHEVNTIERLSEDDLRALLDDELVTAHRARALSPDHPVLRGSAQNPDVFFQSREAANSYYAAVPEIVQREMTALGERTGRRYRLFDYVGHPEAERVLVLMGSGAGACEETVARLVAAGERVGVLKVRLYRPFDTDAFVAALPAPVRAIAVLDRTKDPAAIGEPLFQDVVTALAERGGDVPLVIGGRYGLSSKEFTPAMAAAALAELDETSPRRRFTVGITDDVTSLSLDVDSGFLTEPDDVIRAVFFGLGSDGTVGANRNSIKIIGTTTDLHAQGYFVLDSKKAGSTTVSHLRFGPRPIGSTYLVQQADFVACHQFGFLERLDVLGVAGHGATFLLNSPYGTDEVWGHLPQRIRSEIVAKELRLWVVDATKVAREAGLGKRVNTVLQTCFFALVDVLPTETATAAIKEAIRSTYAKRGEAVLERNYAAVDRALEGLAEVEIPTAAESMATVHAAAAPTGDFVQDVTLPIIGGRGNDLPVSALPPDGTFPTGTARYEKRSIAQEIPIWDPSICIDCAKCALVCPHAAIRMKVFSPNALADAPDGFLSKEWKARDLPGMLHDDPGRPRGLHRLRDLRRDVPGALEGGGQAQVHQPRAEGGSPRGRARALRVLPHDSGDRPCARSSRDDQGIADARAAVRVLGRLRGLRRDAVPEAADPALRRPDARRERDRLLVDLRRQPADDAVGEEPRRARPGVVELAVRGQRRVRPRHAARARPAGTGRHARLVPAVAPDLADAILGADQSTEAAIVDQRQRIVELEERCRELDTPEARQPPRGRRHARAQDRLDRRRRRLGVRHRLRRARPRACLGSRRQSARPRHGGLFEHRRAGIEGNTSVGRREVRRRRQANAQEGSRDDRVRVRRRVRRTDRDGRRQRTDGEGTRGGRRVSRPLSRHRIQPLHRPWDRDEAGNGTAQARGRHRLLAALPLRPTARSRRRASVQARLPRPEAPALRVHIPGSALRDARACRGPPRPQSSPPSRSTTSTSAGTSTSSSPRSSTSPRKRNRERTRERKRHP